jgi:integrase
MSREANRLSDLVIRQAKADPDGKKSVVLADGYGLRLVISSSGRKYWQFKTAAGGKESTAQLGIYPAMSLDAARDEAKRMRDLVRDGRSPVAENRIRKLRNRMQSATTFEGVANELLEGKKKNVSPAYYKKISGGIRANLFPMLGPLPIQSIDAPILRESLRKIEARGALEMLGNVRRWAGEIFDFAKAHGSYLGDNPANALLRNVFERHHGERMRALEWAEVPAFLHTIDSMKAKRETVLAIKLMILSTCRPGEVLGARWAEFDTPRARWTIPAERMKARKIHAVPLSKQALAVLEELRKLTGDTEYLFPSRVGSTAKTLSGMALLKAVKRAAGRDIHAHGFRSVFSTYVAESLKWPDAVKEAALAHGKQGIEGAYDRATHYAERIKLMQWYANQIDVSMKGATIIPIKGKTAA